MMAEVVTRLVSLLSLQERIESSSGDNTFIKMTRALFLCRCRINCNNYIVADETDSDIEASDEACDLNAAKMEREASSQLTHVHASFYCTFSDVLRAPAEKIGCNSYSSIYRVLLDDGTPLIVKRIQKTFFRKDIDTEVFKIGEFFHMNIIALKGCYTQKKDTLLIYACSRNGTVASLLNTRRPTTVIDWPTRMKIIVGITIGLVYLHTKKHMIHGNLTSSNVLLDKNYNPFIVDIGHSRLRIDARPESPYNHAPELLYFQDAMLLWRQMSIALGR
ncbi:probably inactive leucine-rich repeat receptor-like protein kinase IMK2 [Tanacetum coccineum]